MAIDVKGIFDEKYYLSANPDVSSAVKNGAFRDGLEHYKMFGRSEHRQPSGYYNEDYYLQHNPDVAQAVANHQFKDGLEHFLTYGQKFCELRSSSDLIDEKWIYGYAQKKDPLAADKIAHDEFTAVEYYAGLSKGKQHELTAERAFLGLWNDRNFDIIDQLTTGAAFIDHNVFQVLPGPYDGGNPGKLIGGPESGGLPGTEGLKQTAQLFIEAMPDIKLEQKEFAYDGDKLIIRWEENGLQTKAFGDGSYFIGDKPLSEVLNVPELLKPTPRKFQGIIVAHFNDEGKMYEREGYPLGHETTANFLEMGVPLGDIANRIQPVGATDPIAAQELSIVKTDYAAFKQGDVATVLNSLANNVVWNSQYSNKIPFAGVYEGQAGVTDYLAKVNDTVSVLAFNPETYTVQGNTVVVRGSEEIAVKATNRVYDNKWVHVWELSDGKVTRITTYNDTAAVDAAFSSSDYDLSALADSLVQ